MPEKEKKTGKMVTKKMNRRLENYIESDHVISKV
uniref:Uncharacterized protein n=1 Tax=Arundo donax TaxID=35708 RepID=A0A0A9HQI7_ARUDO